jgi:hypothetical protein
MGSSYYNYAEARPIAFLRISSIRIYVSLRMSNKMRETEILELAKHGPPGSPSGRRELQATRKARPSTNDDDISPAITTSAAEAYDSLQELHLKLNYPTTHTPSPPSCLVRRHRPSELVFVHYIC